MRRSVRVVSACAWMFVSCVAFCETPSADQAEPAAALIPSAEGPSSPEVIAETNPEILAVLEQADALLKDQKPDEAYQLLARHEVRFGGSPSFDYLLGVAALDSHRPAEAAFALQRAVLAQPRFAGARLELARAQFENGDFALAKPQFQYLLTQSPPEPTRAVIQHYLDSMPGETMSGRLSRWQMPWNVPWRSLVARDRWSALAQFGAGYDSNANGSTSEQSFLGFTLNPHNVAMGSSFGELTLSGNHTLPLGASAGLITNAQLSHRSNTEASFVDQSVASVGTTAVWVRGAYRFSGGVDGYFAWLDGEDHEHGANLNVGVSRRFGDYEGALSVRAGKLEYQDPSLTILDADRYLAGLSVTRVNLLGGAVRAGITLLTGTDDVKHGGSPYGNDRLGGRLFGSWALRPNSIVYAELSSMSTDYDGTFFGSRRKDDLLGLTVAFDLQNFPFDKWSLAPRLRYMKNDSNISLYEYDRFEAVVFIRRDF